MAYDTASGSEQFAAAAGTDGVSRGRPVWVVVVTALRTAKRTGVEG